MASFTIVVAASLLVATSSAAPQNTKLSITIPEECKGKGFCSIRPADYDEIEAEINSLLPLHLIEVGSRSGGGEPIGESTDNDDNCPSETTEESVYFHNHPNSTKVDIIVQTHLLPQKIYKVKCNDKKYRNLKEDDSQCFRALGLSAFNMVSRCVESYATRELWVYDPELKEFRKKNYPVPVCCSCVTKKL